MDLYTFVLVEPKPKPPEKEKTSTAVFLPLGNFPDGDTAPPWTDEQSEVVSKAVLGWYNNPPEDATSAYKKQRKNVHHNLKEKDYRFVFEFHTHDSIKLSSYLNDIGELFKALELACEGTDMVTTRFDSI